MFIKLCKQRGQTDVEAEISSIHTKTKIKINHLILFIINDVNSGYLKLETELVPLLNAAHYYLIAEIY